MIYPHIKPENKAALVQGITETARLAAGGQPCRIVKHKA